MQSKLKEQLALLRIDLDGAEWLERALNAERRLECLARLAAAVMPPHDGEGTASYRPPSAWRALAREIARANRHLERARQRPRADEA
jgi:hypothetical protein